MKKKILAGALACVMCIGVGVGGTLAWLTAETGEVKNTFTVGDINITLQEHVYNPATNTLTTATTTTNDNYKYVPGDVMPKDPYVVVEKKSEACWVFVKVTEENNTATNLEGKVINWSVAEGWKQVEVDNVKYNVWYKQVGATAENKDSDPMYILAGDSVASGETQKYPNGSVNVNTEVTKAMVDTTLETKKPTLTFDAYAHQSDNTTETAAIKDALTHWKLISST